MEATKTPFDGLLILKPRIFNDNRGWFFESYNRDAFIKAGITETFVQDNHSRSSRGALRGLHFQSSPGQAKLIRCTQGRIWDVAVDIRPDSRTFGKHFGMELSAEEKLQVFIPIGFAHGFLVMSDWAEVEYKCSNLYDAATESGIQWDDSDLAVAWPLDGVSPIVSDRDRRNPSFAEFRKSIAPG